MGRPSQKVTSSRMVKVYSRPSGLVLQALASPGRTVFMSQSIEVSVSASIYRLSPALRAVVLAGS